MAALALGTGSVCAQAYQPSPENIQARKEFQDMKFGIFIHWGIYSMLADGEWVQHSKRIDRNEYSKLAAGFYPSRFNAHEWVKAFKDAGAGYVTITSRHHDGFSMFDTKATDYDIIDATPFKRDILKELADECEKQGIKLHIYYSHMDWFRPDYPLGGTSQTLPQPEGSANWNSYFNFMNTQLTEILTNYGKIGAIWFDGMWDHPNNFDWQLDEQYALIHKLQPACLIGNNHHRAPVEGEDFQMFERDLPGENTAGLSDESEIGSLPLETCQTMNGMWGYKVSDQNYKSDTTLVRLLVRAAGKGANLLMNIGPQPDGQLPAVALERLKSMGKWLSEYGETVYATTAGDVMTAEWGTTTRSGNKLYVHILADDMPKMILLPLKGKVKSAVLFDTGKKISHENVSGGVVLHTADLTPAIDRIITLTVK